MTTTTKERPILFSGPMVQAILGGKKTATRRVVKGVHGEDDMAFRFNSPDYPKGCMESVGYNDGFAEFEYQTKVDDTSSVRIRCPYGKPGDRLWVRETHLFRESGRSIVYRADLDPAEAAGLGAMYGGWKPSIFMPRRASRITLEIAGVRVERLQEITEEDARAEGFADGWLGDAMPETDIGDGFAMSSPGTFASAAGQFQMLWCELHGDESWDLNPWLWVVSFRRVEAPR